MARYGRGREPGADPKRRKGGSLEPEHVGRVLDGVARTGPLKLGLMVGRLARDWPEVVGPELAPHTAPEAIGPSGLVVAASTAAWAARARFVEEEIRRSANRLLETDEVAGVRIVVRPGLRKAPP